jgi:hypothetical protein
MDLFIFATDSEKVTYFDIIYDTHRSERRQGTCTNSEHKSPCCRSRPWRAVFTRLEAAHAGHNVELLLAIYVKCIAGRDQVWYERIELLIDGRPRQDSNLRSRLRRPLLSPLSYGGFRTQKGYQLPGVGAVIARRGTRDHSGARTEIAQATAAPSRDPRTILWPKKVH